MKHKVLNIRIRFWEHLESFNSNVCVKSYGQNTRTTSNYLPAWILLMHAMQNFHICRHLGVLIGRLHAWIFATIGCLIFHLNMWQNLKKIGCESVSLNQKISILEINSKETKITVDFMSYFSWICADLIEEITVKYWKKKELTLSRKNPVKKKALFIRHLWKEKWSKLVAPLFWNEFDTFFG